MDQSSQLKVTAAGFKIIRSDDQPSARIKYKDKEHHDWVTLDKYDTKTARDLALKILLKNPMIIND